LIHEENKLNKKRFNKFNLYADWFLKKNF